MNQQDIDELNGVTEEITAPILFAYVWWVLKEADQIGLKKLYFLARDGYIMHKIACLICEKYSMKLECEYLHCSRYSLRIPSFHLIGDEAYPLIFSGGYQITPKIVLRRISLNLQQRKEIYQEIGMGEIDEDQLLTKSAYQKFAKEVWNSKSFQRMLLKLSQIRFDATIGYLQQQGLTDAVKIGIVDTGWSGSMQRTLRQLLDTTGKQVHITGFYFGMYQKPSSIKDGDYKTFYFNHRTSLKIVAKFNNNLFECICSAPHGMTIGYQKEAGAYYPVFSDYKENSLVNAQCERLYQCCSEFVAKECVGELNHDLIQKFTQLMFRPTKEQARLFANFHFCDDVSESYLVPLVNLNTNSNRKQFRITARIFSRLFGAAIKGEGKEPMYWAYGEIALSELPFGWYDRVNILVWDVIRIWCCYR